MPSTSAILNRSLRRAVRPVLVEAGFDRVDARNGWRWRDETICIFNIRAVGSYFSSVTGWPPGSVGVWLAVFYTFVPEELPIERDEGGRLLPPEHRGHMRSHLDCPFDQSARLRALENPAERRRKDIFWVEAHGDNADSVADGIATALRSDGLAWFSSMSNLENALADVEASRDCFMKFDKAALLARELGDDERWRRYATLAEAEARPIGQPVDRARRYGA